MAARKTPAKDAIPHADDCKGPRIERYSVDRPVGDPAQVIRCQECGAQTTT